MNIGTTCVSSTAPNASRWLPKSFRVSQYVRSDVPTPSTSAGKRTAHITSPKTAQLARMMYATSVHEADVYVLVAVGLVAVAAVAAWVPGRRAAQSEARAKRFAAGSPRA